MADLTTRALSFTIYFGLAAAWMIFRFIRTRGKAALPPRDPDPVPWNIIDVLIIMALYTALLLGCSLAGYRIGESSANSDYIIAISLGCQASIHIGTVFYVFQVAFQTRKAPAEALGLSQRRLARNFGRGVSAYIMCSPLLVISIWFMDYVLTLDWTKMFLAKPLVKLLLRITGFSVGQQGIVTIWEQTESALLILVMTVFAVIIAPVTEEIFFRCFLQSAIRRKRSEYTAIVITAFIFAAVHMNLRLFIPLFVLGTVLSYLYERTGTIVAPLTVHVLHNAVTVGIILAKR